MDGDWHSLFSERHRLYMTDESYAEAKIAFDEDLGFYEKYLDKKDKILECCCGPGYTAIPMSHHFDVTAFDKDEAILSAARQNAKKYGGKITFDIEDFFNIADKYKNSGFNACSSGGVLEHFKKDEIKDLVSAQLDVAPYVFIMVPLLTEDNIANMTHGVTAYSYTEKDWVEDLLEGFTILDSSKLPQRPEWGRFREFKLVVGR